MTTRTPAPRRRPVWIAAALVLTAALVGWLTISDRGPADASAASATVQMTNDMRFAPATVRIQAGATVTWRNTSSVGHTVTADPGLASDAAHVRLPEGASPFNSGNIPPGQSYSRTFEVAGSYTYFCVPHESQGMIGRIVVE